MEGWDF